MSAETQKISSSAKHILIVDDDSLSRRLFGSILASAGFEVLYAVNGNECREIARRLHPDLILMDLNMPVMDGMETLSRMKNEPETVDIPVIFLTNQDISVEGQKSAKELGAFGYMQKGAGREEFLAMVKKVLGVKR